MDEPSAAGELAQLGAYEAPDAKRVLAALEAVGIAFEIEVDESPLQAPMRHLQLMVGMRPPGSQIFIFVAAEDLARASEIAAVA